MMATFWQGDPIQIDYTPGSAVSAGDVIVIGTVPCVAHVDIAANALGSVAVRDGIYYIAPEGTFSAGTPVYWDPTNKEVSPTPTSGFVPFGFALDASTVNPCRVLHSPGVAAALQLSTATDGITALSGGGQSGATAITSKLNTVSTVAADHDSVLLPVAAAGLEVIIKNTSAHTLDIYPNTGDAIDAGAANAVYSLATVKSVHLFSTAAGHWRSLLSA